MANPQIRLGDEGTPLVARLLDSNRAGRDISGATLLQITVLRPDATTFTRTATVTNAPGTDGRFQILTQSGDITVVGEYMYWGRFVNSAAGQDFDTLPGYIDAFDNAA